MPEGKWSVKGAVSVRHGGIGVGEGDGECGGGAWFHFIGVEILAYLGQAARGSFA